MLDDVSWTVPPHAILLPKRLRRIQITISVPYWCMVQGASLFERFATYNSLQKLTRKKLRNNESIDVLQASLIRFIGQLKYCPHTDKKYFLIRMGNLLSGEVSFIADIDHRHPRCIIPRNMLMKRRKRSIVCCMTFMKWWSPSWNILNI